MVNSTTSTIQTHKSDDGSELFVNIIGNIGETCDVFHLDLTDVRILYLNFDKVNYINSVGVKNWIFWTGSLSKPLEMHYAKCPPLIVNQIVLVKGFLPSNGLVDSFYVPYFCDDCSKEDIFLAEKGKHYAPGKSGGLVRTLIPDFRACPKCGAQMEMDMVPDKLNKFLLGIR